MSKESSELTGLRLSFLELITKYQRVEIPLIQRDYAQGRASAAVVRERFLISLLEALRDDVPLSLDFVYGEVVDGCCFQPIDGQQRLTTLFLLHWFLACSAGKCELEDFGKAMKDEASDARFRYAVRPCSHQFFLKLLDFFPENLSEPLAEQIKDQKWFFRAWLHDPTIVGALTMLDAIRVRFSSASGLGGFYAKLTDLDSAPITMDVLNLGSLGLSDEIYVKMNARGKELTGFEKFKAWLIKTHETLCWSHDTNGSAQWTVLLDGDWLDLFWYFHHNAEKPSDSVSKVYFRTFIALAVNFQASKGVVNFDDRWLKADADDQEALWEQLFTRDCIESVFQSLQSLSARGKDDDWPILSLRGRLRTAGAGPFTKDALVMAFFEGTATDVTYESRLWLHAICVFFSNRMQVGGHEEVHWFRVVRNLLANTEFEAKNFSNAIKSLGELGRLAALNGSVLKALAVVLSLTGIKTEQLKEERRKAHLMGIPHLGSEWEAAIKLTEAHEIFRGQIELLLPAEDDLEQFKKRWTVFDQLFDNEGSRIGKGEHLLERAVLAHCEPIKLEWQQRIIFSDSSSNWHSLLDRSNKWTQLRDGMLILIDYLIDKDNLETTIRKSLASLHGEPWMSDIVRYGNDLFIQSETKKIQNYYNNGVFLFNKTNLHEGDILLGEQAQWRNKIIQLLLTSGAGWQLEKRRILNIDDEVPYYKGHEFQLSHETTSWLVEINYRGVVLQKRRGNAEGFQSVPKCEFAISLGPAEVVNRITEAMKASNGTFFGVSWFSVKRTFPVHV